MPVRVDSKDLPRIKQVIIQVLSTSGPQTLAELVNRIGDTLYGQFDKELQEILYAEHNHVQRVAWDIMYTNPEVFQCIREGPPLAGTYPNAGPGALVVLFAWRPGDLWALAHSPPPLPPATNAPVDDPLPSSDKCTTNTRKSDRKRRPSTRYADAKYWET